MSTRFPYPFTNLLRAVAVSAIGAMLFSGCAYLRGSAQINSGQAPRFAIGTSVPLGK